MTKKPMVVLANKMDLPDAQANLEKFKKLIQKLWLFLFQLLDKMELIKLWKN